MDYSAAERKDGSDSEGWGAVVNSVFWKRLLNAQEGSRDLSILLLEGKQRCDPHIRLLRTITLPVLPGVPLQPIGTHAPKLINAFQVPKVGGD